MLCVAEGHPYWSTHFQQANNMAAVAAGDEKSIPALKFNTVEDSKQRATCEDLLYIYTRVRQTIF
jgi:hypothetical protein